MWIGKNELAELRAQIEKVDLATKKLEAADKILLMKLAGLEALVDRLERDGPERTGADRFMH